MPQYSRAVICSTSFKACEDIAPLWFLLDKLMKKPPKIFTHCEGWTKVDGNIFWKHCVSNAAAVSWQIVHLDAVWFDLIPLVNLFNRYDLNLHKNFFLLGIVKNRCFSLLDFFLKFSLSSFFFFVLRGWVFSLYPRRFQLGLRSVNYLMLFASTARPS